MTPEQQLGLGALMVIGAIVTGYIVACIVPAHHHPRIAGTLAANGVIAGLAVAGIAPAAHLMIWFVLFSVFVIIAAVEE